MPLTRRQLLAAVGVAAGAAMTSCSRPATRTAGPGGSLDGLAPQLRGRLVRPNDPGFAELATPRNLRFDALMPVAVVMCADADDVATTMQWARDTGTQFAVRGGGHNYAAASSSRGILISTRLMTRTDIDGTTLRAQAGVRNADLAKLLPRGGAGRLLLPGGNCPAVGIAGLTLGGGIGPNAPWAGLTADRLRRATMVAVDGRVVTASATENADLFWGLRGGAGGNFGVVTDLDFELVEVPVTRATTALVQGRGRDAAVSTATAFGKVRADNPRTATGTVSLGHQGGDIGFRLKLQALAGEDDTRDILAPILRIPGVTAEITERPWWDAYAWYTVPPSPPYCFWDRSLYAENFLSADAVAAALDVVRRFPAGDDPERKGAMGLFGWVGGAVNEPDPGATAYVHRRAAVLIELSAGWATPTASTAPPTPVPPDIEDWAEELWETLLPHTNGHSYQNFSDPGLENWASSYYGDNLVRLKGIKAAWDPDNVFVHPQSIPLPR